MSNCQVLSYSARISQSYRVINERLLATCCQPSGVDRKPVLRELAPELEALPLLVGHEGRVLRRVAVALHVHDARVVAAPRRCERRRPIVPIRAVHLSRIYLPGRSTSGGGGWREDVRGRS